MEANKAIEQRLARIEELLAGAKKVLTLDELATYSSLSKSYLYKLTSTGQIPHYKPNGKHIYFKKEEIDNWLLRNAVTTAATQEKQAATYVTINPSKL